MTVISNPARRYPWPNLSSPKKALILSRPKRAKLITGVVADAANHNHFAMVPTETANSLHLPGLLRKLESSISVAVNDPQAPHCVMAATNN